MPGRRSTYCRADPQSSPETPWSTYQRMMRVRSWQTCRYYPFRCDHWIIAQHTRIISTRHSTSRKLWENEDMKVSDRHILTYTSTHHVSDRWQTELSTSSSLIKLNPVMRRWWYDILSHLPFQLLTASHAVLLEWMEWHTVLTRYLITYITNKIKGLAILCRLCARTMGSIHR